MIGVFGSGDSSRASRAGINHAILLTIEIDSFSPLAWNTFNGFIKHEQCDLLEKT